MLTFKNCSDLSIIGNGVINGQGTAWWSRAIIATIYSTEFQRPRLLEIQQAQNLHIQVFCPYALSLEF